MDYGKDNYAGVTWNNAPDERRILIGWMNNWQNANEVLQKDGEVRRLFRVSWVLKKRGTGIY